MLTSAGETVFLRTSEQASDDKLVRGAVLEIGDAFCRARFDCVDLDVAIDDEVLLFAEIEGTFMRQAALIDGIGPKEGATIRLRLMGQPVSAERRRCCRVPFLSQVNRAFREMAPA